MTTTLTIRKAGPAGGGGGGGRRGGAGAGRGAGGRDEGQREQAGGPRRASTAAAIDRGVCYLAYDEADQLVGTITVDDWADPEFWTPGERAEPALYVHRMIVPRDAAGTDIGGRLLDWAGDLAASAGRRWLRLDAWKGNTALHRYYERHGFTHVRTVDLWHRGSGSLFQRLTA